VYPPACSRIVAAWGEKEEAMSDIITDTSPASLARANELHYVEAFAACALAYGGEVLDEPDLRFCVSGIPLSAWNRVVRAALTPATADERIEWVIAQARARRAPFIWNVGPSMQPDDLGDELIRHGLTEAGEEVAMGVALAALPVAPPLPDGLAVERVRDVAALERWVATMTAGFGAPPSEVDPQLAPIAHDTFDDHAAARYYLASLHGEPVATAALTLTGGMAGVFSVTTIPSARGRGIGAAVTLAPLLDARAAGYQIGVLQASEMGYPVYKRIGFTEQFRYHDYQWKPA
jgi:predicted GNAT family acetyltransferase